MKSCLWTGFLNILKRWFRVELFLMADMLNFKLVCEEIRQIKKFCSEQSLLYISKSIYTSKFWTNSLCGKCYMGWRRFLGSPADAWLHSPWPLLERGCRSPQVVSAVTWLPFFCGFDYHIQLTRRQVFCEHYHHHGSEQLHHDNWLWQRGPESLAICKAT